MLRKPSVSVPIEERLMELTFVKVKIKLKAKRSRSKRASANQNITSVFSSILPHSLSRTTDLHEMLPITHKQREKGESLTNTLTFWVQSWDFLLEETVEEKELYRKSN